MTNRNPDRDLYNQGMDWQPTPEEEVEVRSQPRDLGQEAAILGTETEPGPMDIDYWPEKPGYVLMAIYPMSITEEHLVTHTPAQIQEIHEVPSEDGPMYYRLTYLKDTTDETS